MKIKVKKNIGRDSEETFGKVGTVLNFDKDIITSEEDDFLVLHLDSENEINTLEDLNNHMVYDEISFYCTEFEKVRDKSLGDQLLNRIKEGAMAFEMSEIEEEELETVINFLRLKHGAKDTEMDVAITWRERVW